MRTPSSVASSTNFCHGIYMYAFFSSATIVSKRSRPREQDAFGTHIHNHWTIVFCSINRHDSVRDDEDDGNGFGANCDANDEFGSACVIFGSDDGC